MRLALRGTRCRARAVESVAHILTGRDHEQRSVFRLELRDAADALTGAHATAKHDRGTAGLTELFGEPVEVAGPLGQQQAVTPAVKGRQDAGDELLVAGLVCDELPIDGRDSSGS